MIILLCGLSGAGKTTIAKKVKERLERMGHLTEIIDADEYRQELFLILNIQRPTVLKMCAAWVL